MNKYKWLPELFAQLDDLYRYAEYAGLDDLKDKIRDARQVAKQEAINARVHGYLTLVENFGKPADRNFDTDAREKSSSMAGVSPEGPRAD